MKLSDTANNHVHTARAPRIVLGVTGSIAAFRAAQITSTLTKSGVAVDVVLTAEACKFVTPLTFASLSRRDVTTPETDHVRDGQPAHIHLADRADLVIVAPATANLIAQYAAGLAPDPLTCVLLATRAPVVIAPAMNGKMWLHSATQANVKLLKKRGVQFIGPDSGMLACGYEGVGRLWPADEIARLVLKKISAPKMRALQKKSAALMRSRAK